MSSSEKTFKVRAKNNMGLSSMHVVKVYVNRFGYEGVVCDCSDLGMSRVYKLSETNAILAFFDEHCLKVLGIV